MKKGFTLSELLMALVVLGVLCATVIPAIVSNTPNSKKILMKRAYYTTSNIIKDIINNPRLYDTVDKNGFGCVGFNNQDEITYGGKKYSGTSKFSEIFISLLRTKDDVDESTSNCSFATSSSGCRTVYTSEGMRWSFNIPQLSNTVVDGITGIDPEQYVANILVDVNGSKGPNCYQGSTSCSSRTKDFDQFIMGIWMDGTIEIQNNQTWVKEILNVNSSMGGSY